MNIPPREENYIFGLGIGEDREKAKILSVINAGQQFSSRVESIFLEKGLIRDNESRTFISTINRQYTSQKLTGVKFMDDYRDDRGNVYVLSRAPLNCLLDTTEAMMISYMLDIGVDAEERTVLLEETKKKIEEESSAYYAPPEIDRNRFLPDPHLLLEKGTIPYLKHPEPGGSYDLTGIPWEELPVLYHDGRGDAADGIDGHDITAIQMAFDDKYIYFVFHTAGPATSSEQIWYHLDMDVLSRIADSPLGIHYEINARGPRSNIRDKNEGPGWLAVIYEGQARYYRNGVAGRVPLEELDISPGDEIRLRPHINSDVMGGETQVLKDKIVRFGEVF